MTLESERAVISVNGVSVPGVTRNGLFISEQPINTFMVFRSGAFLANTSKNCLVEFPVTPKTLIISDTTTNNTYTLGVLTPEGVNWIIPITSTQLAVYGSTKIFNFGSMVIDKGSKLTFGVVNAIQSVAMFSNLAYNVDVRDF